MSQLRIGSLFAGYGGLDRGVQAALGGTLAWYADCCKFDKDGNAGHHVPHRAPCSILERHHPDVPNLGDVTKVTWAEVPRVDILTGGSPCQDLSHAGKRAGMTEGTRSNLWVAMREAIAELKPSIVVWENVRGAYSAEADSDLEQCEGCLGDRSGKPVLRALGRVLGDLSDLGYVGGWHGLRAADIGAPHGRFRVFVVAYAASDAGRLWNRDDGLATHTDRGRFIERDPHLRGIPITDADSRRPTLLPSPRATDGTKGGPNQRGSSGDLMLPSAVALLPTPTVQDGANTGGASQFDRNSLPLNALVTLLPTPAVNDMGAGKSVEDWDAWTDRMKAEHGNGNGHGKSLSIEAQRLLPTPSGAGGGQTSRSGDRIGEPLLGGIAQLLPTPRAIDGPDASSHGRTWSKTDRSLHTVIHLGEVNTATWGDYAPAIARWEQVLGRPAPEPTMLSTKGNPQLSPAFVEWLMGLPAGHVTDTPSITRNEALKALGNGVVEQQAEAAVRYLLPIVATLAPKAVGA